ncbi:acyl carrier protein [Streptomyces sp. NPDC093149]|uniref:acyl carrier protein n=1 Tax=Streptomyces sp. NPDC093149 TaxID=3366031 RepID=UPI003816236D
MTETTATSPDPAIRTPQAISSWLVDRVSYYLERPASEIDEGVQLAEMGLDSVYVFTLCGDIEDRFGLVVEPTMAWDHPTVEAITAHLVAELAGRAASDR